MSVFDSVPGAGGIKADDQVLILRNCTAGNRRFERPEEPSPGR
jgi:hypothetical protein